MLTDNYVVTLVRSVEQKHSLKFLYLHSPHVTTQEPTVANIPLRYLCCFRYRFGRRVLCAIVFEPRSDQRRFLEETVAPQNIMCCNFIYSSIKYTITMHTLRTDMGIECKPTKIALLFHTGEEP